MYWAELYKIRDEGVLQEPRLRPCSWEANSLQRHRLESPRVVLGKQNISNSACKIVSDTK